MATLPTEQSAQTVSPNSSRASTEPRLDSTSTPRNSSQTPRSNNRIVDCTSQSVTYQYTPSGTKKSKTRTVTGIEFVRGFLQHVLPKGFRKVRHYGWMASHSRTTRDHVKWLVWLFRGWTYWLGSGIAPQPERPVPLRPQCAHCGGALRLLAILSPTGHVLAGPHSPQAILPEQAADYFDTG